ncbi:hypothetical protein [Promicromonospora iranensis]|uniref:hypothetical protein n=1 Tax=Promicromonospora iranensis TaxID=1105144 RepID=UPI0023A9D83F|nr:hypothetical protein [Promicromonospora iranensis]
MRPRIVATVLSAAAICLLASCSATPDTATRSTAAPDGAPISSASPSASTEGTDPCGLLDPGAIATLAGTPIETYRAVSVGGHLPGCQWGDNDLGVQVIQVSAGQWANSMPDVINQLRLSGALGPDNQKKLDDAAELLDSEGVDPASACELFSVMVEQAQNKPGMTTVVNYIPTREDPQAITAQSCIYGVYSSVMLTSADLTIDDATTNAATNALADLVRDQDV